MDVLTIVPTTFPSMASTHKRTRSKFWYAAFTDANGRRLKKSTKTTDKKTADKIAHEFESVANKRRTLTQLRRVIGEMSRELLGDDLREPTLREHIEEWLNAKAPSIAPATAVFYRNATSKFLAWLGGRADQEISLITRANIVAFRNERAAVAAPKTVNHEIKVLRMVFRSARKDGIISDNPAEFAETVRDRGGTQPAVHLPYLSCVRCWMPAMMSGNHSFYSVSTRGSDLVI